MSVSAPVLPRVSQLPINLTKLSRQQTRKFRTSPYTRSSSTDPKIISDDFFSKFSQGQTFVRSQLIDANQLRLFSLTLNRRYLWSDSSSSNNSLEDVEPVEGTPVPPGYHLAYFTPAQLPGVLGMDGTDTSFNPDAPFTRRMWAGGSVNWPQSNPGSGSSHYLRVGDVATETTRVLSCEPKIIKKTGESILVVGVEKEFRDSKGNLCVVDKRNWVFRGALDPTKTVKVAARPALLSDSDIEDLEKGKTVRPFNRDVATLFRFSALTFNPHRIHYDLPWATYVEGHRNVVVHGPMNLVSMLDMWRDEKSDKSMSSTKEDIIFPKKIVYRATSPVYAGEGYRIIMDAGRLENKETEMVVVSDDGTVCMKGSIAN